MKKTNATPLPHIYDLGSLRRAKAFLEASIDDCELQIETRTKKFTEVANFFMPKKYPEDKSLSDKVFNVLFDTLVAMQTGKMGLIKALLFRGQAALFRPAIRKSLGKAGDYLLDLIGRLLDDDQQKNDAAAMYATEALSDERPYVDPAFRGEQPKAGNVP